MNNVKINQIEETTCQLFDPEDNLIGDITSVLQLNDVRIQIMQQKLKGYYFIWMHDPKNPVNGRRLDINPDGRMPDWPNGFFDEWDNQLSTLIGTQYE